MIVDYVGLPHVVGLDYIYLNLIVVVVSSHLYRFTIIFELIHS